MQGPFLRKCVLRAAPTAACVDDDEGVKSLGAPNCAGVAGFCQDPTHGANARKHCPKTCGECPAASTTALPAAACVDDDVGIKKEADMPNCAAVAAFCADATNGPIVRKHCPKTCGECATEPACLDDDVGIKKEVGMPNCAAVAAFCADATNGPIVRKHCPKTCGECGSAGGPCTNTWKNSKCSQMGGFCREQSNRGQEVRTNCPITCGIIKDSAEALKALGMKDDSGEPLQACWQAVRDGCKETCSCNVGIIRENCKMTCGECNTVAPTVAPTMAPTLASPATSSPSFNNAQVDSLPELLARCGLSADRNVRISSNISDIAWQIWEATVELRQGAHDCYDVTSHTRCVAQKQAEGLCNAEGTCPGNWPEICWDCHFATKKEIAFQIPPNSGPLELTKDIIVREGYTVFLDGGGNTVQLVGLNRFNVETGGRLCLFNVHIVPNLTMVVCQPCFGLLYPVRQNTETGIHRRYSLILAQSCPLFGIYCRNLLPKVPHVSMDQSLSCSLKKMWERG